MTATASPGGTLLAEFIRRQRDSILGEWETRVRTLSPASQLSREDLRDHLPHLIDRIAALAEHADAHGELPVDAAEQHAVERLRDGFELADVVREYAILREVLLDAAADAGVPGVAEVRLLNRVLDYATHVSVSRYAQTSQRLLRALDRVSTQGLVAKSNLAELLQRLLLVMMEASPAVDTAAILLQDGDRFRVRAAVGFGDADEEEFSVAFGEGFTGTIAAEGKPRLLRHAAVDPLVLSTAIKRIGVRALYGVPMFANELIGVAHMGSRSAFDFSEEDMLLFRTMANRAAAFIIEAQLREDVERRAAELEAVIESIPDGVYVGDATGIKKVNRRGHELLGLSRPEDAYRPIDELVKSVQVRAADSGEPLAVDDQPFMRALRGEVVDAEVRIRRRDTGEDRCLRSIAAPVRLHDRIVAAVAINTDITERKRTEEQLRREAEYRERFIGILSHDLRTPVSAIGLAAALLLKQETITDAAARIVRRILSSTARIEALIRDLLDFSRERSGSGMPLSRTPMDLADSARHVVEELMLAHPSRQIELTARGDTRGEWDEARLAQSLSNLVSNALQYSPPDTVVYVRLRAEDANVRVEVTNQGAPIPESLRPHLFSPFKRADSASALSQQGLGLGLFITRSIVSGHGGTIEVSTSSAGTTFTVCLPRRAG